MLNTEKQDAALNKNGSGLGTKLASAHGEYCSLLIAILLYTDKRPGKFKEWLKIGSHSEVKPNQEVMEVLSYLAYETVREVDRKTILPSWNHSLNYTK